MKGTLVRYKTKPDQAEENERLIKQVFDGLQKEAPEGIRYMCLKLPDGNFVHFASFGEGKDSKTLTTRSAFVEFQKGIRERVSEPPVSSEATVVGNYRTLGE